jgi:ATP adenylyltransferase
MDQLWSPWRMEYILENKNSQSCVFCFAHQDTHDADNLVLYRGPHAYVILNKYPYNTGHALIIPYNHVPSYENLTPEERAEMMELLNKMTHVLRVVYQPDAFNIGANIGTAAGAGIAPHVHFHVLPRWTGDTNFLTTVTQTRVIPEKLCDTYAKLLVAWQHEYPDNKPNL